MCVCVCVCVCRWVGGGRRGFLKDLVLGSQVRRGKTGLKSLKSSSETGLCVVLCCGKFLLCFWRRLSKPRASGSWLHFLFGWFCVCFCFRGVGGRKDSGECWLEPLLVPMRLDGDATTVAASPASESLWGVVGLIQQARDRSPLSVARIAEREREEVVVRRREESRRREEEKRERALQERKREGKVHNRDEKRTQSSPVPLMTVVVVPPSPPSPSPRFIVGYALTSKKIKSFIQPKLESHASTKGISLVAINRNKLLTEQGPFDVILHKITGKEWRQELEDYKQKYPDVIVLDPPEAIQQLRNRQSMLQDVAQLNLCDCGGHVDVPRQLVITGDAASIPSSVAKAGLKLPLVVKPLVADGTAKSHAMSLAYDKYCLTELDPPLVLQEFVNHGGVLFKVYIVGDQIRVVRRFSLPDVQEGKDACSGAIPFPRVSNAAATAEEADLDPQAAELPPPQLLDCLSRELRHRLGLRLFNLDMIRQGGAGDHYYVIDINYFPGYGKMPDYEFVFTDFLLSLARSKGRLGL